ncbi:hypothetical protein KIW84_020725 [Lathyrus oleraceus]|uniref:3-oxo-5-alpha-steroid 4-dehydrogenase C-terminal domain-containing protein n=1 Tax=Pisum sativum TaxID=3888 RepID=A0A9D4Y5T4_PEA|nr:hypothetical protein KIW84_020725 [Pisum sativum]
MKIGFGFGILCQVSNFYCHIILRNLRGPAGEEIYQWLGFNIATQTIAGYVFVAVATFIMTNWALAKHRRLKKLFDGKEGRPRYPRRWVILPPFLYEVDLQVIKGGYDSSHHRRTEEICEPKTIRRRGGRGDDDDTHVTVSDHDHDDTKACVKMSGPYYVDTKARLEMSGHTVMSEHNPIDDHQNTGTKEVSRWHTDLTVLTKYRDHEVL